MRIGEILQSKAAPAGGPVVTIGPDAGVRELLALLAEHNIGAVIVSSDGAALDGIVSERDVVRHLHRDGTVVNNTVGAIMTAVVETCTSGDDLDEVMSTMTARRFRHVPVIDDGVLAGIISIGDVVKHKIADLEFERDQLDSYVHSS
ncbi:CBS domain-containing protein [Nocardioides sp. R-C-SC26]|uniref:CBS domain-containing protein n=1 Tax=Nocardioides sp. R-C-SC26 TaxID=2870414 RepID=UPI001E513FE0|nr:CBS domain-containing protein [Nocardioides sp. R-C-SC26]